MASKTLHVHGATVPGFRLSPSVRNLRASIATVHMSDRLHFTVDHLHMDS